MLTEIKIVNYKNVSDVIEEHFLSLNERINKYTHD